jgi:hypothetical protein
VQADFLKMKGTPSAYLSSFVDRAAGNRAADSELDVSFGSSNGRQQT